MKLPSNLENFVIIAQRTRRCVASVFRNCVKIHWSVTLQLWMSNETFSK